MKFCFSLLSRVFINKVPLKMSDNAKFSIDIGGMRKKYKRKDETFTEKDLVAKEPFGQFKAWFDEACQIPDIEEANAMCLATASKEGIPSARYVLLKGYGTDGFRFFTNYLSQKGRDLEENPQAALVFYWECLKRSVRVSGTVEKLPASDSDNYFHSRPKESQLGAAVSNQSQVITDRSVLVTAQDELRERYTEKEMSRPSNWGGYIVRPSSVEFWQGQSDRLHDRIRFRKPKEGEVVDDVLVHQGEDGWIYERLAP